MVKYDKDKLSRLCVRLPPALQARIDTLAERCGVNRSEAVRLVLEEALQECEALPDAQIGGGLICHESQRIKQGEVPHAS